MVYFISGHRDISVEKFNNIYVPKIKEVIETDKNCRFVLAECSGVDRYAQDYLRDNLKDHSLVTVYHMYDSPRYLASKLFKTIGGFKDDISRDEEMTNSSDIDIAFIEKGRWTSGTAQNILRRFEKL